MPVEPFAPAQIVLGALIGFVPSAALFIMDGRRMKAERIRQSRIAALDAAVGCMNKLLDHAASVVASRAAGSPIQGVLPHDPLAYYTADLTLVPDRESVEEFVHTVAPIMSGATIDADAEGMRKLQDLFTKASISAGRHRDELIREGWF